MKRSTLTTTVLSMVLGLGLALPALATKIKIKPIENITNDEVEPDPEPLTMTQQYSQMNEHEEAEFIDKLGMVKVNFTNIHLGDLSVVCPLCGTEVDHLAFAIGMAEDRESGEGEFNDLLNIGIVAYSCGHIAQSPCLSDKVARILNAEELGRLTPDLFTNLECDEHRG